MIDRTRLRTVADGVRFVLLRSGKTYRRIGHDPQWLPKIYVIDETTGERTHLNFMVYVRPIVKPRVRPKLRRDGA